jgi:hypothetical protein
MLGKRTDQPMDNDVEDDDDFAVRLYFLLINLSG